MIVVYLSLICITLLTVLIWEEVKDAKKELLETIDDLKNMATHERSK